jgi:hypothetical protein
METSESRQVILAESRRSAAGTPDDNLRSAGLYYGDAGEFIVDGFGKYADIHAVGNGHLVGKQLQHDDIIRSVESSRVGDRLVTSSRDGTVRIWDARTGDRTMPPFDEGEATVAAAFSVNSDWVVSLTRSALIWSWEVASHEALRPVPLHGAGLVGSASFGRDGTLVATSDYATAVKVWDASTGLPLTTLPSGASPVTKVMLSENGNRLLTKGVNVSVWDLPVVAKDDAPLLLRWGEAVAGLRVDDSGGLRSVDNSEALRGALRKEADAVSDPTLAWRMVRWFFADPTKRTFSPLSEVSQ